MYYINMFSYSYNVGGASINRLDELLNRNQLIYQNLKQKLDGINRSNQNIYRNINHIQSNFSQDPFSQESSAIQREPTIKNTSVRIQNEGSPNRPHSRHLDRIDEHQEVTFSQENLQGEEQLRARRMMQEQRRLYELELMLEKERQLEEQRLIELEIIKRQREQNERYAQREERMRKERQEIWRENDEKINQPQFKREIWNTGELSDRSKKGINLLKIDKQAKNSIKNNSIYLSKVPKTSIVEAQQDDMPTFRQSFTKVRPITQDNQEEQKPQSSKRMQKDRQQEQKAESYRGKELKEVSGLKINRIPQQKPKKVQTKRQAHEQQGTANQNYPNTFDGSSIVPDAQQSSDIDLQHTIARSEPRREVTPYSQLNSHFRLKLQEIEIAPQCILFAPFNKVYRSPILQLKPGCVILQRKSKTSSIASDGNRSRIVDGLKYKFRTVHTDQQLLLKHLFCSEEQLSFSKRQSNKIAIVGGRQALKKKLHMGLLAYCHQQLAQQITQAHRNIVIKLQHQAITPNEDPFELQNAIQADPTTRRLALMKLEKMIYDIYDSIKKMYCGKGTNKKVLRMTKLGIFGSDGEVTWSCSIISSNRYDYQFLKHLRVNKICWSINPLVKYYDDVKETLESMRYFIANRKTA